MIILYVVWTLSSVIIIGGTSAVLYEYFKNLKGKEKELKKK